MRGTSFDLEVNPTIPQRLERLQELADNLWYSWDRPTRALFARLQPHLWHVVGHSPKGFLKRVHQRRLDAAAEDPAFLEAFDRVLERYDSYHATPAPTEAASECGLVAYFCAEFGFHESLPIYSGGLGILAGDHCKAASDSHLPFVAVGLLYDQGYFLQTIDAEGNQRALYANADFEDLPISPVLREDGSELRVRLALLPGREVEIKVWRAQIGRVVLFLLDSAVPENSAADRAITHRLYGGDRSTRIEQEILLGVGGARVLQKLGYEPAVWHINEGHAAFLVLERIRMMMQRGLDFASAHEAVAASTVFTTHTAVPAGHDRFGMDTIRRYFETWASELGIPLERLLALGETADSPDFDMTSLAIRGSRYHNGVSAIHGEVSARICAYHWPQIEAGDNPIDHVTNGVHVPTFLNPEWHDLFDRHLGPGWMKRLTDEQCWRAVHHIPAQQFWAVRQTLKSKLLHLVRSRVREQHMRNQGSEAHLDRLLKLVDPDKPKVLTIGFARRFATYKRATLLFENLDWLAQLVSDPQRPVLFLFAGKAHPTDWPGQELIRRVAEVARMPQFEGRILLLEGHDLRLSRRLVSGVDVWLNNPIYPLEASGTSGMKAAMNGVINLSVLDGWWGEGYDGSNGWAIKPVSDGYDEGRRDHEEARTLYEILQDAVLPMFHDVGPLGYSESWVDLAKRSIATLLPRFNTERMLRQYVERFYRPATLQAARFAQDEYAGARELAPWKARIRENWSGVRLLRHVEGGARRIVYGQSLRFEVAALLNGLGPEDVKVEMLLGRPGDSGARCAVKPFELLPVRRLESGEQIYALDLEPDLCGKLEYRFRIFPRHALLTHPFETGMMGWL